MEEGIIEAPIGKRKIITVPDEVMKWLGAEIGHSLVFKRENKQILVGVIKRTIIEEKYKFTID